MIKGCMMILQASYTAGKLKEGTMVRVRICDFRNKHMEVSYRLKGKSQEVDEDKNKV